MNTYLTEFDGYAQTDIEAWHIGEAEDWLRKHIEWGNMPPGTEIIGELEESYEVPAESREI